MMCNFINILVGEIEKFVHHLIWSTVDKMAEAPITLTDFLLTFDGQPAEEISVITCVLTTVKCALHYMRFD